MRLQQAAAEGRTGVGEVGSGGRGGEGWMKPSERETRTRGVGPGWGCIATSSGH
jgi:hypothetical protein